MNADLGELYRYDGLNQLTGFERGVLSSSQNNGILDTVADPSRNQAWTFDALGNWTAFTTDGTTQNRTANAQNELTNVGSNALTFDANGNMTTDETGKHLVYDAWNRLVAVTDSDDNPLVTYQYDALGHRVIEDSGTPRDLYYSAAWQVIEERVNGTPDIQYVWSAVYVDAMVLRDGSPDENGDFIERLYVHQDENWNVTALVDNSGNVVERYIYDPYGQVTVLGSLWNIKAGGSDYAWIYRFQALRFDDAYAGADGRNRVILIRLGRPAQADPLGLIPDVNQYRYENNIPVAQTDPTGLTGNYTTDLAKGVAKAYVEWWPELGVAEIKIMRGGQELMRFRWSKAAPEVIESILEHAGKKLPGVAPGLMRRISLNVTYHLKKMILKAGGTFSRSMIPGAVRTACPTGKEPKGGGGFLGKLFLVLWIADEILGSGAGRASAQEIPRPTVFEIPLAELGLTNNLLPLDEISKLRNRKWYISKLAAGPISSQDMITLATLGLINTDTLIWDGDTRQWRKFDINVWRDIIAPEESVRLQYGLGPSMAIRIPVTGSPCQSNEP